MKSVITVIGKDTVGIIAKVSALLAKDNINIIDISQTTDGDRFLMVMIVDISGASVSFYEVSENLKKLGDDMGLKIQVRHKKVFDSMHRI
jgi:ACT domain-containing protein